jgi:hypothetical protein
MRFGAPPSAPPKPSAAQREPFVRRLLEYPLGQEFPKERFFRTWADRYQVEHFHIWGQDIFIIPGVIFLPEGGWVRVTEPTIRRINPDRRGVRPMLRLKGQPKTWYSQVLHWIDETVYEA